MDEAVTTYLPQDRRYALAHGNELSDRAEGAVLFADVSGFTPLTETLARELGPQRGAEELTRQLNLVYDVLIAEVDRYKGSVIGFSGDAITCWFDADDGERAVTCALEMQVAMRPFANVTTPLGGTAELAIKVAVASGPVRRFVVGDPSIQLIDVLAGATLDRLSAAERHAGKGEVVISAEVVERLGKDSIIAWRPNAMAAERYAVVGRLARSIDPTPWPALAPHALSDAEVRHWLLPVVYERVRSGQSTFLAELRPAVALFVRFDGIDYDRDVAAGPQLDSYIRWVQQTLAHYEGVLLDVTIGDKGSYLYAAFGAPFAHEDDPARAVAAALDLCAPPASLEFIQNVRIGLSRGRMLAGPYGGATRRTYGVLGDEVNMAARLMSKAAPGQILATQRIADAVGQRYRLAPIGMVQVKGKQAPVAVSLVLGRQQPAYQRHGAHLASPLVGRESEVLRLDRVLDDALAGAGQVLRLEGGAGIGKSRLAAEFASRAAGRGFSVAMGSCQTIGQDGVYTPWRQIFRMLFGLEDDALSVPLAESGANKTADADGNPIAQIEAQLAQANPNWLLRLPLLGDLLGLSIPDNPTTAGFEPRLRQLALFGLATDLVQGWAQSRPLLVLIDDAQWMDEASRGLMVALARAISRIPVVLSLVQRPALREDRPLLPELSRLPYHQQIVLGELEPEGVTALVGAQLHGQVDHLVRDLLLAQAQGHPFFTEELIQTLRELGRIERRPDGTWMLSVATISALRDAKCLVKRVDGAWALAPTAQLSAANLGIPDSIHGVVLSRMDRLPEDHKLTLKVASVIGYIFAYDLLARAHPVQPAQELLLDQIDLLESRDFARMDQPPPQLTYAFKHSITQEVTYTTLLEAQQRELHRAVGLTLETLQPDAVEVLAYHYRRSGLRDKLLFYLEMAARRAQREYANETALSYYQEALALEERWTWRKGQVEVLHILGQREEEREALHALEAAHDVPAFEVAYLWGQYHEAIGDYEAARSAVEQALAACKGNQAREMRCLAQLGLIARRQGDYERAKRWYLQALLLQEQAVSSDEESQALAQALNGLGIVHRQQADFEQARACYERALHVSRAQGDRRAEAEALNGMGAAAYYQRNFAESLSYYRAALEIQRTIGERAGEGTSLYNLAMAGQEAGEYSQARAYFSAALAIQQAIDNRWEEANVWNGLGMLYHQLGDLSKAHSCLQQGLSLSQAIGDEAGQTYILGNLALVLRDQGDLVAAEQLLIDGMALAQAQDDKHVMSIFLSHLGIVNMMLGKPDSAINWAEAALALRRETDLRLWTTADLATLAVAHLARGDAEQALDRARQAFALLNECGGIGPEAPQQDYFTCYRVLAAVGQMADARNALQAAYDLVIERAAKIADRELRESFVEQVPINHTIVAEAARVLGAQPNIGRPN